MTSVTDPSEKINMSQLGSPKRNLDKSGSAYEMCNKEVMYHGFLCFAAIAVIVTQATVLNFYIIAYYRENYHHVATYFLFLGDLFIVCIFAISFTTAYRYIHLRRKLEMTRNFTESQIQLKIQRSIYKHVMWLSPRRCGTLPFSFISWFVYSCYLVAKISLILSSDIPSFAADPPVVANTTHVQSSYDPIAGLGSNLLKVTTGLAALVFIIMLQAHHNHDPDSPHSGYITGVCHNIAVEVFDSVTLFSLLVVPDTNILAIRNLNHLIIVLSSLNLILPTLTLYSLSRSDFGRHLENVIEIKVLHQLLHLLLINIPFLGVRIYLWAAFNYELSLFVVKNLCYIFMLVHSLYPGIMWMVHHRKSALAASKSPDLSSTANLMKPMSQETTETVDSSVPAQRLSSSSSQRIQGIPRRQARRPPSSYSGASDSTTQDIELTPINRNPNRVSSPGNASVGSPDSARP